MFQYLIKLLQFIFNLYTIEMENSQQLTPLCAYNKQVFQVCFSPKCTQVCFICDQKCQCQDLHKECDMVYWDYITKKLNRDLIKHTPEFKSFSDSLDQLYQNAIKDITKCYDDFKKWRDEFGLTESQLSFLHLIEQGKFTELTSAKIYEIRKQIRIPSKIIFKSQNQLKEEVELIKNYTEKIIQQLKGLYDQNKVIKEKLKQQKYQDQNRVDQIKLIQHIQTKVNSAHKLLGLNQNGSRFFTMMNDGEIQKQLVKILEKINTNEESINNIKQATNQNKKAIEENKQVINQNKQAIELRIEKLTETITQTAENSKKENNSKLKSIKKQFNANLRMEEIIYKFNINSCRFQAMANLKQEKTLFAQSKINGLSNQIQNYCDKKSNQITMQALDYYKKIFQQIDSKFKKFIKDHGQQKLSTEQLQEELVKIESEAQKIANQVLLKIEKIQLFTKKIKTQNLLYRASENNFQVSNFWDKCNGKTNTLTILKTQFGKIIGGYTPLAWNKSLKGNYQQDTNKQTFLFSITQKHKIPISQNQQYALHHSTSYGPTFGGGYDLYICNKANVTANSYGYIGHTYNNGEYSYNTQQAKKKWSGQSNGHNFLIQQWEVYEITFE